MAVPKNNLVRLSVDIPYEVMKKLDEKIPWGMKAEIFKQMAIHLIELMEQEGSRRAIFMIADGKMNVAESLVAKKESESEGEEL